jgi:hypothetical protein
MQVGTRLNEIAATVARWRPCADLEHATDAQWQGAVLQSRSFLRDRRIAAASYLGLPAPAPSPALASPTPPPLSADGCPLDPRPEPEPEPEPRPGPTTTATPPRVEVAGASAARVSPRRLVVRTRRRSTRRLTVSGSILLPAATGRAGNCGGHVTLRVKAGRRTLATRRTAVRFDCTYATTFKLRTTKRRLTVHARFGGAAGLLPASAPATRP